MSAQIQSNEHLQEHQEEMVRATAAKALALMGVNHKPEIVEKLVATLTDYND